LGYTVNLFVLLLIALPIKLPGEQKPPTLSETRSVVWRHGD